MDFVIFMDIVYEFFNVWYGRDCYELSGSNGIYGKSILSNSSIKSFFLLEEDNIKILSENVNLSEKEKIEIKSLKRGESLMFIGDSHVLAKVECSELEKKIIE